MPEDYLTNFLIFRRRSIGFNQVQNLVRAKTHLAHLAPHTAQYMRRKISLNTAVAAEDMMNK